MHLLLSETILILSILCLLPLTLVLLRNRRDLTPLPAGPAEPRTTVSILIPARNEERTIAKCVESACRQAWPALEVIVLDDQSEDGTGEALQQLKARWPDRLRILQGRERPDGWLGKTWACHQLAGEATGDLLIFIDADVQLPDEETVERTVTAFEREPVDMVTLWPVQILETFWEKSLIPMVYHGLLTILPSEYVYRKPRWMPTAAYRRMRTLFAAACGQFIAFRRESYQRMSGHESVKGEVVEDVALARRARETGLRIRMYEGGGQVTCRMYHDEHEIFEGFRKNLFAGFDYRWSLLAAAALFHTGVYLYPFLVLPPALFMQEPFILFFAAIAITLILLQRILLARWFGWSPIYAWTHPLAILWFLRLSLRVARDRISGTPALWKGRPVR